MKLGLEHHEFTINVSKDYFAKKFNFIIGQSNSFKGNISADCFRGTGGANYFSLYMGVIQTLNFDFRITEVRGKTVFKGHTYYNIEMLWMYVVAFTIMLIVPATNLFPAAQITGLFYVIYAASLLFITGFLFWVIRNSKQQWLEQFEVILRKVEAAYLNRK